MHSIEMQKSTTKMFICVPGFVHFAGSLCLSCAWEILRSFVGGAMHTSTLRKIAYVVEQGVFCKHYIGCAPGYML